MTLLFALACGGSAPAEGPSPDPAPPPAPVPAPPAAAGPVDPLAGKSLAEICGSNLVLLKWTVDDLSSTFHEKCCVPGGLPGDAIDCELDWPFSDVPDCSAWDDMRNGIFARYGYVFTKLEWQERFAKEPWYAPRPDFDASWMNDVAKQNVEALKKRARDKVSCLSYAE
ncbi:MAG: YARHG domain-containing protein [Myxococcota bacterium]